MGQGDETDEALVARVAAGDRVAASQLVLRHTDKIMGVCYRMLGDRSAAEDATQETFLRLWQKADRWKPQGAKFETWLYRVAMNLCLDRLRRRGREAPEDAIPIQADGAPPADEQIAARETASIVQAAIDQLSERQRQAIILCHYQELSNIEAAAVMDVSVEAMESLLARGRRALRARLLPEKAALLEGGSL